MSIGPVDIEFVVKGDVDQQMRKVSRTVKGESGAMSEQMQKLTRNSEMVGDRFGKLKSIAKGLLPVASIAAAALAFKRLAQDVYQFSKDYSRAMREVQTISQAVQQDFSGISKEIINISAISPDGAIGLANAYYQIVSAGHDGAAGLELLKVAAKSATAGITDTKTAADGLTTILNAWGKEAAEAEKVADVMFKTVEKGKTTFPELAQNIATVAPLASSMKISFEEISAAIATLTKQGTPTAQAVTQIRSSLVNMNKALGDGWSEVYTYQEALQKVAEMAGGSQSKLRALIPDIEGMNAVLALSGDKAKEAAGDLDDMTEATGAMASAYGKMLQEADAQWSMVHNKWKRELKGLGDQVKETSTILARFLNAMMTNSSDAINILENDINGFIDRWAAMQALRDETLGGWTQTWYGKMAGALTGLDLDEWRALFADKDQLKEWLENSKAVREERKKQEDAFKRTDTASIITEISDIDAKIKKEQELLRFYENKGADDPEIAQIKNRISEYENEKLIWENLLDAKRNAWNKDDKGTEPGGESDIISGFKAMQEELKKLHEDILDADQEQQKKIADRIVELEKELALRIQIADEVMRTARNAVYGSDVVPQRMKPIDNKLADDFSSARDEVKHTGLEIDKLNQKIEEGKNKAKQLTENYSEENFKGFLNISQEVLGISGHLVRNYQEQLNLTQEQAYQIDKSLQAMSGIMDIASGNYVEGIFKLIDGIFGLFAKVPEEMSVRFEKLREEINKVTHSLEIALQSMQNVGSSNTNYLLSRLQKSLKDLRFEAEALNKATANVSYGSYFDLGNIFKDNSLATNLKEVRDTIDELTKKLAFGNLNNEQRKSIEAVLESYNELIDNIDTITTDLTGTTVNALGNGLVEAFLMGEDAAEHWGKSVNDIIKHIIIKQLSAQLLTEPLQRTIDNLIYKMRDGLEPWEASLAKQEFEAIFQGAMPAIEQVKNALEGVGIHFGDQASETTSMTGAIRALTEETGGMIYGQLMGIRYDIKAIIARMERQDEDLVQRQLVYMSEIASNTRHNSRLVTIENLLQEMNLYLKNI